MILYGSTFSPFVRKVMVYANERGIELELSGIGTATDRKPEFLAASPLGKMPALVDGDYALADSSAIIHYLEAKCGASDLLPSEAKARGKTIWYEEWADTGLFVPAATIFFNRFIAPSFFGRPGDLAAADKAEEQDLPRFLDYLEGELADGREWLVGDKLTLADIAVAMPFLSLRHSGSYKQAADYPAIEAYVDRISSRESVAPLLANERAIAAKVAA